MSDGPSIRNHRITKPYFRICSTYKSRSQAPFYLCARRLIANQAEGTFGLLRYSLGGDRPSQTAQLTLFRCPDSRESALELKHTQGGISRLAPPKLASRFKPPTYPTQDIATAQYQPTVKVHGVFPSCCGYVASSPRLQFHRVTG